MSTEEVRRMDLLFQENRLATFKDWVFTDKEVCSKQKLAEAGFYFAGDENEPDVVECFLCEKSLDGWDPTDDPWLEHVKHSPNCPFAQLMSPEDALTYYQFLEIKAALMKGIFNKAIDAEEAKLRNKGLEIKKYVSRYLK